MYMCDNRLSDHTNADLCIDGKSVVSHDIACLRTVLYIVLAAAQETFFCQVASIL